MGSIGNRSGVEDLESRAKAKTWDVPAVLKRCGEPLERVGEPLERIGDCLERVGEDGPILGRWKGVRVGLPSPPGFLPALT
mmetsp:Transcript_15604/g.21574  ORF Transcript_15604/g.21574 Transcript_15604/m.21574 type:complete len:81 (-) Transcript_15604:139-381(-)